MEISDDQLHTDMDALQQRLSRKNSAYAAGDFSKILTQTPTKRFNGGPRSLSNAWREEEILRLRIVDRKTEAEIGKIVGISQPAVVRSLKKTLKKTAERNQHNADILRETINEQFEALLNVHFPEALKGTLQGIKHADLVMDILSKRIELYGLVAQDKGLQNVRLQDLTDHQLEILRQTGNYKVALNRK